MISIWMSVDSAQIRYYSNVLGKPHLLCPRSCWRWSGCRLELAEQTRRWASQSFEITVFNRFKGQFTIFNFNWQGVGEEVGRETAEGSGQAREISYFSREQKQTTIFYFSREQKKKEYPVQSDWFEGLPGRVHLLRVGRPSLLRVAEVSHFQQRRASWERTGKTFCNILWYKVGPSWLKALEIKLK